MRGSRRLKSADQNANAASAAPRRTKSVRPSLVRPDAKTNERSAPVRALDLLLLVASSNRPMALPELSTALAIPKPTVFRLCQRLERDGYLERETGSRHFHVGPSLVRLGLVAIRGGRAQLVRHAILQSLVDSVGETCNFTTLAGTEVLYLDRVETRWPLRLHLEPGSRVPLHCTASGKLFLAHMDAARRQTILSVGKLTPNTPSSITSRTDLERHLARIAAQDYSIDNEEFLQGLVAIAVPIRDDVGHVVAALACHAPVARLSVRNAVELLPKLRAAASKLSVTLPTG